MAIAEEDGFPDGTGADAVDPGVRQARTLTKSDLQEVNGCLDLEFGFSYSEIIELCLTLPVLELCYYMSQWFVDEHQLPSKAEHVVMETIAVNFDALTLNLLMPGGSALVIAIDQYQHSEQIQYYCAECY